MTETKHGLFQDLLELRVGKGIANGTLTLSFEDVKEEDMDHFIKEYKLFRRDFMPVFGRKSDAVLPKHVYRDLSDFIPATEPYHPPHEPKPRRAEKPPEKPMMILQSPEDAIESAGISGNVNHGGQIEVGCMVQQVTRFTNGEKFFGKMRVEKIDPASGDLLVVVRINQDTEKKHWKPAKYFAVVK